MESTCTRGTTSRVDKLRIDNRCDVMNGPASMQIGSLAHRDLMAVFKYAIER